jgi:hypothetical protein
MRQYLLILAPVVMCLLAATFRVPIGMWTSILGMTVLLASTLIRSKRIGIARGRTEGLHVCLLCLAIFMGSMLMAVAIGLITPRQTSGLLRPGEAAALVWSGVNALMAMLVLVKSWLKNEDQS